MIATAAAMALASLPAGLLARIALARPFRKATTGEMLSGLAMAGPLLLLSLTGDMAGPPGDVAAAGTGAAMTFLLLGPVVCSGMVGPGGAAWPAWRRTVLPFTLAAAAMWYIIALADVTTYLEGQFFLTLFVLGTWLFSLRPESRGPEARPRDATPDNPHPSPAGASAVEPAGAGVAAAENRNGLGFCDIHPYAIATGCVAAVVVLAGVLAWRFDIWTFGVGLHWRPLLGGLMCAGPLLVAAGAPAARQERAGSPDRDRWFAGLGYAAMTAFCLVPGLAGFLQTAPAAVPPYGPYGVLVGLAATFLLGLGREGLRPTGTRAATLLIWGTWVLWVIAGGLGWRLPLPPV